MKQTPKSIVVATDFSDLSRAAYPHARALAESWGAEVIAVHVIRPETYPTYRVVRGRGFPNFADEMQKSVTARLESLAEGFSGVPFRVESRVGWVHREVGKIAVESGGIIAVATHGRGGIVHALLGSNAERIVRSAPVPVLTVHADGNAAPLHGSLERIILATDYSDRAHNVFAAAKCFATPDTELHLVHVFEPPSHPISPLQGFGLDFDELEQQARDDARDAMLKLIDELRNEHPNVRGTVVDGAPAKELLRIIDAEGAELIGIATAGHTGLKRAYLGSVAAKVVRKATCPVLTVRDPHDVAEDGDEPEE